MTKPTTTLKNFGFMLSGNFGAQIISLLFYPILVRIYSPEDFGLFGTFLSCMVIGGIFASGQLQLALIKCHDENEIQELYWLFKVYALIGSLVISVFAFLMNLRFEYFPHYYLIFLPLSILAYLSFEAKKMLAIRSEMFKDMSRAVGLNRFLSNISKAIIGNIVANPLVLIVSEIFTNVTSYFLIGRKLSTPSRRPQSPVDLLKKYRHFPLYASFSNFFQLGLIEFPVLILALYFLPNEIGAYVLTLRILLQPLAVIGNSLGSVVSKKIVMSHLDKKSSRRMLTKIYSGYIVLGLIIFLTIKIIPAEWFIFALGKKWEGFKDVLLPMSLLSAAKLSSGLHIYYYVATDNIRAKSVWKAIQFLSVAASIVTFSHLPFVQLLWIASAVEASIDLLFILYTITFKSSYSFSNT